MEGKREVRKEVERKGEESKMKQERLSYCTKSKQSKEQ
jgi:hypothetical protein